MSFVVKAVKGVVKAVGNIVTGIVKAVGNVVSAVVNFVASPFMGIFGVPDAPSDTAEAERQQGVLVQRTGSNVNIPVIYGYRKVGGIVTFAETGSDNNRYLWVAYVLSEGPIEGLHELYIDDNQLPANIISPLNEGRSVQITSGKYANRVQLQFLNVPYFFRNLNTHPVIRNNICRDAPGWKDSMIYNGLAVMLARYEWKEIKTQEDADNNPFSGSIPQLQATIMGRRVASLLPSSGQDQHEYNTANYRERYSTNPAEILLDYLRNPRYGKGMVNNEIDWESFQTAAAKCNQQVEYVNGIRGPILTANVVLDTSTTIFNNTKLLLANMRGYLPYVQGKYKLKIEDAGNATDILSGVATIVKTFDKDNIIGNITYTGIERNAKYTHVTVRYVDPDNKWSVQEVTYPEDQDTRNFYVKFDGGRENSTEITFSACTNYAIAKDFARLIFNKSRFQDSLSFRCDATGFDLEPGDNIHVNSNILKFSGEDKLTRDDIPWRIVSIRLNNDYTFDIGAVRNPDFLYPHTRVGEIDIVLPPYVPKGAEIYFPPNQRTIPYGLVPPTRSPHPGFPPQITPPGSDSPVVPGITPTDPNNPVDGGGVGGPGGPINGNDNPNNPPPLPPKVYKLDNIVDILRVSYASIPGSAAVEATFTFAQPDHPQYAGLDIWYKLASNTVTTYRHLFESTVRSPGSEITFTLTNLRQNSHELITRVRYTTGESSTGRTTSFFFPQPGVTTEVNEGVDVTNEGWSLPIRPNVNARDTYIESISAQTLLTNGLPRNPRQVSVTLRQFTAGIDPNDEIIGLDIYYKPSSFTLWSRGRHTFRSNYVEGRDYTFQLPFTLGSVNTVDKYDFIFRYVYIDGSQSRYQTRIMDCSVESPDGIIYDFNPFQGKQLPDAGKELVDSFPIQTTDEAPIDPPIIDPRDFFIVRNPDTRINTSTPVPSFRMIVFDDFNNPIYKDFSNPQNTWLGVRVEYRSLGARSNNKPVVLEFLPVPRNQDGQLEIRFPINFEENYEYVITPIVRYLGGRQPCRQSWYGRGSMTRFLNIDYWRELNFELIDTNVALRRLSDTRSIDPANPTLQILGWEKVQLDSIGLDLGQVYYKLTVNYSLVPGYQAIKVYRRSRAFARLINELTFYGYGRWEEITDTSTSNDGTLEINLRPPINFQEFNSTNVLVNPLYATNKPIDPRFIDDFIVTVQYNNQVSDKAYFLAGRAADPGFYIEDLLGRPPVEVLLSDYNNFSATSLRNISDARPAITDTNILINQAIQKAPGGWNTPTPLSGPAVV
jgi:hypothetical protein